MKIEVNNIELNYEVVGSGKPFIMIHGNGEDHYTFDELADKLKDKYQIFLIDSRCHGKSSMEVDISYDLMALDIIKFCEILGLSDIQFLGFSDGGIIGLKIAILKPDLIQKMTLCGANFDPSGIKRSMIRMLKKAYRKNKSSLIKLMLSEPKFKIEDLKNIKTNTLILAGQFDVVKYKHTLKLHSLIDNSKYFIIPRETHESYVIHSTKLLAFIH